MSKAKITNAKTISKAKPNAKIPDDGNAISGDVLGSADAVTDNDTIDHLNAEHSEEVHEAMKPYVAAYPGHSFLISSDGQVFLKSNLQDAKAHQKYLDDKKDLIVYSK